MTARFENRSAIVTGAGGGIGLEIARSLSEQGAAVIAIDLKERPRDLPEGCFYLKGDVTDAGLPSLGPS